MIFARHGQSHYTGKFPDLTEKGAAQMAQAAESVIDFIGEYGTIEIDSSPLPRTRGSATILAKRLGYTGYIRRYRSLRCSDFYDPKMAILPWKGYGEGPELLKSYETHADFESGKKVEKRSSIHRRFCSYLTRQSKLVVWGKAPDVKICVGHFEFLYRLARLADPDGEPLGNSELIWVVLYKISNPTRSIRVQILFRDKQREFECNSLSEIFD